jgi:hypothetical protein
VRAVGVVRVGDGDVPTLGLSEQYAEPVVGGGVARVDYCELRKSNQDMKGRLVCTWERLSAHAS